MIQSHHSRKARLLEYFKMMLEEWSSWNKSLCRLVYLLPPVKFSLEPFWCKTLFLRWDSKSRFHHLKSQDPRGCSREFIENQMQTDRPNNFLEQVTFADYCSHLLQNIVAHSLGLPLPQLKVRSPSRIRSGICRFCISRKFGELPNCCFDLQIIQHDHIWGIGWRDGLCGWVRHRTEVW